MQPFLTHEVTAVELLLKDYFADVASLIVSFSLLRTMLKE